VRNPHQPPRRAHRRATASTRKIKIFPPKNPSKSAPLISALRIWRTRRAPPPPSVEAQHARTPQT
jgi:hypothetical protein